MQLVSIAITDFRCLTAVTLEPDPSGTTVIVGPNGVGKTSVLEATAYLSTLRSFRGVAREAMVRRGATSAIVRAETLIVDRPVTIEAELTTTGRSRTMVNRQPVRRRSDLHDALRTTLFSPEDIQVVRGAPADRRAFLDDTTTLLDPRVGAQVEDLERVLRQRGALLKQAGGRLTPEVAATLDVWDDRLVAAGTAVTRARESLADRVGPLAAADYARLAGAAVPVAVRYRRSWEGGLAQALAASRRDDLRRGTTLVGPHRDELELELDGLPSRTHASQGEQRSLALALRLAAHELATDRLGTPPVLLLDDVFSELDPYRSAALLEGLPPGQAILTTAVPPPAGLVADRTYEVDGSGIFTRGAGR
jgi:DNA replication and repair protein RecF